MGTVNFLVGKIVRTEGKLLTIHYSGMELVVPAEADAAAGEVVTLVVRPECIRLAGPDEAVTGGAVLDGMIENYSFR